MIVTQLFSRRWWYVTIFVILGVIFLTRLGLWQLDRLTQRRALNQLISERWDQAPYDLNQNLLPTELETLGYRRIQVTGTFDYSNQVLLKNQNRQTEPGTNIVTPLLLPNGQAILVARGWIPYDQSKPEAWDAFTEATGETTVIGMVQKSQILPGAKPPTEPQTEWFRIDVEAIQRQIPYPLLPGFLTQLPEPGRAYDALPYREVPFEITEGNHFSYALQWFMFAAILGGGYLPYIAYQEKRRQRLATMPPLNLESVPQETPIGVPPVLS
ncbi:MAG: SURF1 family protein [Caldilineaceae bacterium]|nr:SURF1 family protein [Caldilineaceae bacterium]